MIRNKLLYAALLIVMVLFYILYRGALSLTLLIFTAALPLLLLLSVLWLRHSVHLGVTHKGSPQRGETFHWLIQIRNPSWFSDAHARLYVEYSSSLGEHPQPLMLYVPVMMRNVQRIRMTFHARTCGVMKMRLVKLEIYGPLRIFRQVIPLTAEDTAVILPAQNLAFSERWQAQPHADADTAEYSKEKAGDDPSEIFDLHTYHEGDAVSRIHWKLSSKHDDLMVKEYSLPLSAGCLLLPDYRLTGEHPEGAQRVDAMLSALHTAALQLTEHMMQYRAGYYTAEQGMRISPLLQNHAELQTWLEELVHAKPAAAETEAAFLHELTALMTNTRTADRVLLFTPCLDRALTKTLMALPAPGRVTVFAVNLNPADAKRIGSGHYTFTCVSVTPEPLPETDPPPMTDFDTAEQEDFPELTEEGGGAA